MASNDIPVSVQSTGIQMVNGNYVSKGQPPKERQSKFHVIANTNIRPKTTETAKEYARILENVAEPLLSDSDVIGRFMLLLDGAQWSPDVITSIECTHGVELGQLPKGRRIHMHIVLDIKHYSKLRVDPKKFKEVFNEFLQGEPLSISYVHVTVEKNSMTDYAMKGSSFSVK